MENLKSFLGCNEGLTCIYGEGASGKTTICLMLTASLTKNNQKVIFIDTENGFSLERLSQIYRKDCIDILDKIFLLKVNNFYDQCKKIDSILKIKGISLIIVDSIGAFYRKELKEDVNKINRLMSWQLRTLNLISKNTPVVVTNQVYKDIETNNLKPVGGDMLKNWCKHLIRLEKNPKRIILERPEKREILFEIREEGIKLKC